jgi:hypothetical protein
MSLITSGVKMLLCPRTALPPSSIALTGCAPRIPGLLAGQDWRFPPNNID